MHSKVHYQEEKIKKILEKIKSLIVSVKKINLSFLYLIMYWINYNSTQFINIWEGWKKSRALLEDQKKYVLTEKCGFIQRKIL